MPKPKVSDLNRILREAREAGISLTVIDVEFDADESVDLGPKKSDVHHSLLRCKFMEPKPRRWLVECHQEFEPRIGSTLQGGKIREVKPITRDNVDLVVHKVFELTGLNPSAVYVLHVLRMLGIEVED